MTSNKIGWKSYSCKWQASFNCNRGGRNSHYFYSRRGKISISRAAPSTICLRVPPNRNGARRESKLLPDQFWFNRAASSERRGSAEEAKGLSGKGRERWPTRGCIKLQWNANESLQNDTQKHAASLWFYDAAHRYATKDPLPTPALNSLPSSRSGWNR